MGISIDSYETEEVLPNVIIIWTDATAVPFTNTGEESLKTDAPRAGSASRPTEQHVYKILTLTSNHTTIS
jgi:hypothetical protein